MPEAVREWCDAAGLVDADMRLGGDGILVSARRP
jgi:hypothetical protein